MHFLVISSCYPEISTLPCTLNEKQLSLFYPKWVQPSYVIGSMNSKYLLFVPKRRDPPHINPRKGSKCSFGNLNEMETFLYHAMNENQTLSIIQYKI